MELIMAKYYVEFEVPSLGLKDEWEVEAGSELQAQNFVDYEYGNDHVNFISVSKIGDCA